MAGQRFKPHWDKAMAAFPQSSTDVLASVTEEAFNELLTKHHQFDRDKYRLAFAREFPEGGRVRKFQFTIDVQEALKVFLPPQDPANLPPPMVGRTFRLPRIELLFVPGPILRRSARSSSTAPSSS